MLELVSILIPAYNAEKWIKDCIESAVAQTWLRKEIIVVDDGSRDATLEVAQSYTSAMVLVKTQENMGASKARNHALSLAQGDYIQWLDADDLLAPDKITVQMREAEPGRSSRTLLSGAWGRFYHRPDRSKFMPDSLWEDLSPVEWMYRAINGNLWMAIESWLVSRRLSEMTGPWNENLFRDNDGEYFSRILINSIGIRFMPEARCYCRISNFGISHDMTLNDHKLESLSTSLLSYIKIMRFMEESSRSRSACLKMLNRWAIYFYPERPDLLNAMKALANELGGELSPPRLRAKYQWLQKVFGWRIAKKAQNALPALRSLAKYTWERILFR